MSEKKIAKDSNTGKNIEVNREKTIEKSSSNNNVRNFKLNTATIKQPAKKAKEKTDGLKRNISNKARTATGRINRGLHPIQRAKKAAGNKFNESKLGQKVNNTSNNLQNKKINLQLRANAAKNKVSNLNPVKRMGKKKDKIFNKVSKNLRKVVLNPKVLIITAIIIIVSFITIPFFFAIGDQYGSSPHYYCNLKASKEIKQTPAYKQYCGSGKALSQNVDENGIPMVLNIVQYKGYKEDPDDAWNSSFINKPYAGDTFAASGCGPSAMAMAIGWLKGEQILPDEIRDACPSIEAKGAGSYWHIGRTVASHFGFEYKMTDSIDEVLAELENGNFALSIQNNTPVPEIPGGHWTSGGHFIMMIGAVDGKIAVADSGSEARSYFLNGKQCWPPSAIDKAHAGPYTIIYTPDDMR